MWILRSKADDGDEALRFRMASGHVKTVGRATRADFIVDAALVSRIHCRLTASASGELLVEDLRSTNGTFVNDERIKRRPLASGDLLRIGRVELSVQRESQQADVSVPASEVRARRG
jgi:pSer/pThr/pTyr-binding forkhead associated (FHA) protein